MAGPKKHPDDWVLRSFSRKPQKSQPHVFSPLLWTHLLFLLVGLEASGKDSPPTVVPGILGGSVTFSLNISVDTEIEHVTWNGPQKALALAVTETQVIIMDKSYQNRLNISWNYSLSISNLTLEDAGSYKAQINRKNSEVTADEEFILRVYEQVQVPRVVVESVNMSDSASCNITLICSVERAGASVLYSWTPKNTHASESHGASTITIYWMPCDPDLPYTCTARNPVSQSTSGPIHARQFCTAPGASRGGSTGETVVGILGESVTLPLTLSASRHVNNIVWMFNTSIITKKQEVKPKIPDKNSGQDYSLKIGQLKMENAGHYYAYVCSEASGVISRRHFTLLIYRRLKKPKVTGSLELSEDGICRVSLTCSVEDSGHNVTYLWTFLQKGTVMSQGGSHLNISWRSDENHPNFTCTTRNPVSKSFQSFLPGDICPGEKHEALHRTLLGGSCSSVLWDLHLVVHVEAKRTAWVSEISGICPRPYPGTFADSVPDSSSNQAETPADAPGYEKLDTLLKTAKQRSRPPSASSSDSSGTTEETTDMVKAGRGQEDTGPDSASERPAEYDLVMLRNAPAPTAQDNTVYAQVFLNLQVSPFDQYTFPPPPVLTPSNILDDLVPPHGEPGPAAHEQTSVALLMLTKPWAPLE
ncbi:T-lymphocyte surface antigen Ly-9 isoform X2 [Panthera tigris]|uniref:T-lymphocyte surface antigen Ly-9 isoform X2 n=1 Tax=Panthera tigris TaxID=9694 RepID=UPI001C6FB7F3|nr:T-lymphocyte surface antigen Ly-9 isoform X2 [Panthera tigris]